MEGVCGDVKGQMWVPCRGWESRSRHCSCRLRELVWTKGRLGAVEPPCWASVNGKGRVRRTRHGRGREAPDASLTHGPSAPQGTGLPDCRAVPRTGKAAGPEGLHYRRRHGCGGAGGPGLGTPAADRKPPAAHLPLCPQTWWRRPWSCPASRTWSLPRRGAWLITFGAPTLSTSRRSSSWCVAWGERGWGGAVWVREGVRAHALPTVVL